MAPQKQRHFILIKGYSTSDKNHQVDFFTHDAGEKGVNGHWKDKQEFPSVNQIIDNKNYHIRTGYGNNVDVDIDFLKNIKTRNRYLN